MSKWALCKIEYNNQLEKRPVPVVWDGCVASRGVGEGRLIPVLIIDTTDRPDIDDMVSSHRHLGSGDVESCWSRPSRFSTDKIALILSFTQPSKCVITLEFDLMRQGGLLDQIVQMQGMYLRPGRPGDRIVSTLDKPTVLVEVPSKRFSVEWENIYGKSLEKRFRKSGLSRSRAKQAVKDFLTQWRDIGSLRIPYGNPHDRRTEA